MEYLSLEIFDLEGTGSKYAMLPEDVSITITDTSEIFANGDVWSYSFKLSTKANAHIFGSAADLHGARLHEQVNKRRARLWVMGVPLYLGYLKLGDEVEVDENGDVSVTFESGQKTFREMIEGMNARDVSVGDVQIGIALNRKRVASMEASGVVVFDQLGFSDNRTVLNSADFNFEGNNQNYAYIQRWPKLVMSKGWYVDNDGARTDIYLDTTNAQNPYDAAHPFCNINVCYQKRVMKKDDSGNESEQKVRGYTVRLGRGADTWSGGDGETRYNNSPNFFLLYWLERLFKDKNVVIQENQMEKVDGLRRVFLANLGCFYEEMDTNNDEDELAPGTPARARYGNLSFPAGFITNDGTIYDQNATEEDDRPKLRVDQLKVNSTDMDKSSHYYFSSFWARYTSHVGITGYRAFATGENYPNVEASEIINSTEAAFGVRFLFDKDYTQVRIVLLRNIFQNEETQKIDCEITKDEKVENSKRGFLLTYGGDEDNTDYNYNDWSRVDSSKSYADIVAHCVTSLNKTCYYTKNNGNAYRIKIDEAEDLYFPVLVEVGGYNDAKDGNCEGEDDTIETVTIPAKPLIMNNVDGNYCVFFSGDLKVPGNTTPMSCSIKVADVDQDQKYNVGYYDYDHAKATAELENLWAEYYELEEKYNAAKAKERYPHVQAFSYAYKAHMMMKWREIEEKQSQLMPEKTAEFSVHLKGELYAKELIGVTLQDSYTYEGNDGTPFDKANIGLCFGMMRGSGLDSYIFYDGDEEEKEGNDYWEMMSGTSLIDHPDSCDNWGNRWDYSDDYITERGKVPEIFRQLFPLRDEQYFYTLLGGGDIRGITTRKIRAADGKIYTVLFRAGYSYPVDYFNRYMERMNGLTPEAMMQADEDGYHGWKDMIIELDSSWERYYTLNAMIIYYKNGGTPPVIHNGVATRYGNFSLKLRAEKPGMEITDPNLRGRGLADQFYKEYSYWVRNARIVKRTVKIELAQLLSIDKTKRVTIGDVTGFIRKIQYSVSNKTGLGRATFEIMYI